MLNDGFSHSAGKRQKLYWRRHRREFCGVTHLDTCAVARVLNQIIMLIAHSTATRNLHATINEGPASSTLLGFILRTFRVLASYARNFGKACILQL